MRKIATVVKKGPARTRPLRRVVERESRYCIAERTNTGKLSQWRGMVWRHGRNKKVSNKVSRRQILMTKTMGKQEWD